MKITTKTWLAKVAAIFIHITSLLHRISHPVSFYSKTKIGYIFSFHSSFAVLTFTFDMRVWMNYCFCIIKNNGNNGRCTTEGEKSNKYCARRHTIFLFVWEEHLRNISFAVISLFILRENSFSEREILDNKNFSFTTLTRLCCLKHQMALHVLSAFVFLGKQNLQIVWN